MAIYDKPVRLLMKDFVYNQNIAREQIFSKDQMMSWFRTNNPKNKTGTISAHLLKMIID